MSDSCGALCSGIRRLWTLCTILRCSDRRHYEVKFKASEFPDLRAQDGIFFLDNLKYLGGEAELYTATPYLKQQQFTQISSGGYIGRPNSRDDSGL
jgi:hypothetical protein